ncbi:hypothetical protein FZEAL_10454 [Fusarium zealandicum]|uniref:F-box domain-containing protein n=1 Tax=Fusarium zealandicum TaxID=1053134 RepID=A0A8H4U1V1_9HYPO|nr:hypothetical protein FZEAL_10454 [Fusarium zealandicum]
MATINTLPPEILFEILCHLPPPTVKNARLTNRAFNSILAKRTFEVLVSFLDPSVAQRTLCSISRDPQHRRRRQSIWSPRCSVPKSLPIDDAFLMALWAGLRGDSWAVERGLDKVKLDVDEWQSGVGRDDITEEVLREALFRYALYLSYVCEYEREKDSPQAWVFDALCKSGR